MLRLQYEVREAREADLMEVSRIESLSFTDPYPGSLINSLHALHGSTFLVATLPSAEIIGYSVTAIRYGLMGHLLSLATRPDYRRNGVATALVLDTIRLLREERVRLLRLEARVSNVEAIALYEKLGFERGDIEADYYPDGEAAQVMYKALALE